MKTGHKAASAAFADALELDPENDRYRHRLGLSLAKDGRDSEASAVLAPIIMLNDQVLERFLSRKGVNGRPYQIRSNVLLLPGRRTRSSRCIAVNYRDHQDDYFEHTLHNVESSNLRRAFYVAIENAFGARVPDFLPKLHFCEVGHRYGYFLYDYADALPRQHTLDVARGRGASADHAINVADRAIEISAGLHGIFGESRLATGGAKMLQRIEVAARLEVALENARPSDDGVDALASLPAQWSRHQARFGSLPTAFIHGNLGPNNVLFNAEGNLKIVDWETYGYGPIGLDLVMFFGSGKNLESEAFEASMDKYFDATAPRASRIERRYTTALLAVMWALGKNMPLPEKWLYYLARE